MKNLFKINYQFRISRVQLLGHLKILARTREILQSFLGHCSSEVCMRVLRLQLNHHIKIFHALLILAYRVKYIENTGLKVTLSSLMDKIRLISHKFNSS